MSGKRMMLTALTLLVATTTAAAADLCFDYYGGGSLVSKRFRMPSKDTCVPFNGFEPVSLGAVFSGTACTQSQGYEMILHYTLSSHTVNTGLFRDC